MARPKNDPNAPGKPAPDRRHFCECGCGHLADRLQHVHSLDLGDVLYRYDCYYAAGNWLVFGELVAAARAAGRIPAPLLTHTPATVDALIAKVAASFER